MSKRGLLLILSSPSGAGKTTLARDMQSRFGDMQFSVSATTRAPRIGEEDGREYYFKSRAEFLTMIDEGALLEHAEVFGNLYGTPRAPVVAAMEAGRDVIFDVDWQGGEQLRASDLAQDVVSVFILPPSIAALEARLTRRAQDDRAVIERRMAQSKNEISHWEDYDYVLINDDLARCAEELAAILRSERLRRWRQPDLSARVSELNEEFSKR